MFLLRIAVVFHVVIMSLGFTKREYGFLEWSNQYGKNYKSLDEYNKGLSAFLQNSILVDAHNNGNHTYTLELNQFADLTSEEFAALYLMAPQHCSATKTGHNLIKSDEPIAVDWRRKGVVSPVKNQGGCGSCWTFSTTGAMEAHMTMKYNKHMNLSEQQLIDCAQAFDNHGCSGGLPSQAFEYIHYEGGLMREQDYPYLTKNGTSCHFNKKMAAAFVGQVVNITKGNEEELANAVAYAGPVSIAFDVMKDFHLYKSGIYSNPSCSKDPYHVNHAVLAVGYNVTESGKKYWIVKNSWGTTFGMNGYSNIERGSNMCGLADCASYPLVTNR